MSYQTIDAGMDFFMTTLGSVSQLLCSNEFWIWIDTDNTTESIVQFSVA